MFEIPDPLHPALVHFPIAFVLVGTVVLFIAMLFPRASLVWFAAVLMLIGAITAGIAEETGEHEARMLGLQPPPGRELLAAHGEWAEKVVSAAWISAVIAVVGATLRSLLNYSKFSERISEEAKIKTRFAVRIFVLTSFFVALWASFAVSQVGHYGGRMVYHEHIGMRQTPPE